LFSLEKGRICDEISMKYQRWMWNNLSYKLYKDRALNH
jgi:hypothetical protein